MPKRWFGFQPPSRNINHGGKHLRVLEVLSLYDSYPAAVKGRKVLPLPEEEEQPEWRSRVKMALGGWSGKDCP